MALIVCILRALRALGRRALRSYAEGCRRAGLIRLPSPPQWCSGTRLQPSASEPELLIIAGADTDPTAPGLLIIAGADTDPTAFAAEME